MGSSGVNDGNLTYLKSHKKLPAIHNNNLNLSTITKEVGNIPEVFDERIMEINSTMKIFTKYHKLDPV